MERPPNAGPRALSATSQIRPVNGCLGGPRLGLEALSPDCLTDAMQGAMLTGPAILRLDKRR